MSSPAIVIHQDWLNDRNSRPALIVFGLLPTALHSGTGVESTISRRIVSDWSDFFIVDR